MRVNEKFEELTLEGAGWVVRWVNCGEGENGDYDPDDPNDTNYLRFDVYLKHEKGYIVEPDFDASFCTRVPAFTNSKTLVLGLYRILMVLIDQDNMPDEHREYKRSMERLSWMTPNTI